MTWITDIHAHVLPGVDDGPKDLEATDRLLAAFRACGTDRVFCTSHLLSPHFENSPEELRVAFAQVEERHTGEPAPELAFGAELRITASLADLLRQGVVPALGDTRYVLCEFRSDHISARALELIHELVVRGYQPIMAHPERNLEVQRHPERLDELAAHGLLFQVTARCYEPGPRDEHPGQRLAWRMLEEGRVAVIASDAHDPAIRPPGLRAAYEEIARRAGDGVAELLMDNANAIWANEPVRELALARPRRGLLRRWFG
ncbi:CpsB/CapC family capsule biosynthesis tyrosine phosphatase [Alicyclobacillus sp.]|uniref:tyrosine-protein phosphatase n=1 Tax=Alicyclobacillus sp. TaxID=61169 RepID=UPI0025BDDD85|nr:CpsB/CapC family capsule biosynthesis tyrosine phosphatase [Alicyclobacillus sp.]